MAQTINVQIDAANLEPVEDVVRASVALSSTIEAVLERLPPEVNPVVVDRRVFAPVQAALDAYGDALAKLAAASA